MAKRSIAPGADPNLPLPPAALAKRLEDDDFVILSAKGAGGGVMGAKKLELAFSEEPKTLAVKWKATGSSGDGWNNSPRREVGVYAMQAYFLDADDYLVPPAVARGIPLETYAVVDAKATPTFEGTCCVFGELAAWLENVEQPEKAFDPERFDRDPAYALCFARLNLLHYLVDHRDSRANNFLMSTDRRDPRVFSIDNGIAFGGVLYNFFTSHFNEIRVPMPRSAIERLRQISRGDLDRLAVLGQLEDDGSGVLRNVEPEANLDPEKGVRRTPAGIQFGLTQSEIDAVAERTRILLARIDAGELQVF